MSVGTELSKVKYSSFQSIFQKMQGMASEYQTLPMQSIMSVLNDLDINNPIQQNKRIKSIGSSPINFKKSEVENMIKNVSENEKPIRNVEKALEYTSYPLFHTRTVYQNLLTYHSYVAPYLTSKGDSEKDDFWREWKLIEKLRTEFDTKSNAHMITGQTIQEGKVFYYPRFAVDKSHNKVNYAFMQQLPSDYVKIIGFNNKSKYTLSFNLMYFLEDGTDYRQFGSLFEPYITDFIDVLYRNENKTRIDLSRVKSNAEAYKQNGRWYYWVTLPVDKVFTFEIDDVDRNVVTPFTGLLLDMLQLSQLEALQLELLSNPLVAVLHGEIPYFETKDTNIADQYKLSNAGRLLFESLWYQMTARTNTGGIGIYAAPFKNMTLETLPEAPNATNIVASGYRDAMNKAGLSGIIPANDDTRAGLAQISYGIESQFPKQIYRCFERMFNTIIESLNLKYDFRFYMFGDLATDELAKEDAKKDMTLGILPAAIIYNALHDRSIIEDMAWSEAVANSGIMENRLPLVSTYTMSPDGGLPPSKAMPDEGGRPQGDGTTSEGAEQDEDSMGESRFN